MRRGTRHILTLRYPILFNHLAGASQCQGLRRHRIRDHRPGADITAVAHLDRRHQSRVAPHERAFANFRLVLAKSVVVARYSSSANVRLSADVRVSEICQVARFRARAEPRLFQLDKVADVRASFDMILHAQSGERPYMRPPLDTRTADN